MCNGDNVGDIDIDDGENGDNNTDNIDDGNIDIDEDGNVNHVNIDEKQTPRHLILLALLRSFFLFHILPVTKDLSDEPF